MQEYWRSAFPPLPPTAWMDLRWLPERLADLWRSPGSMTFPGLAAFFGAVGAASLVSTSPWRAAVLLAPIVPTLAAAALKSYPFSGRLLLFLVPALLIFLAEGVSRVQGLPVRGATATAVVLCVFLLWEPLARQNRDLFRRRPYEESRGVIRYLAERFQPEDAVFVYAESRWSFLYYARAYGIRPKEIVFGRSEESRWDLDVEDIGALTGRPRVWFLFSDVDGGAGRASEENFFLFNLDRLGRRLDSHREPGAVVHLYDLS
jgi:hypothetical protein